MDSNEKAFEISQLILRSIREELDDKDKASLNGWANESTANRQLLDDLHAADYRQAELKKLAQYDENTGWELMLAKVPAKTKSIKLYRRNWFVAAAASLLLFLSVGTWLLLKKTPQQAVVQIGTPTIKPGTNQATLTLANGQLIMLNAAKNGRLALQGNAQVVKAADGALAYDEKGRPAQDSSTLQYNTLSTPKGGQYHLTLTDGTRVWLNAASSIRYPVTFSRTERLVEITGEAYFEVSHNPNRPFRVKSRGQTVEVLGTHFDINAYEDEPLTKTTLLEGKVKVITVHGDTTLKPGMQASVSAKQAQIKKVSMIDTEEAVAWKNGYFNFNNSDIHAIMRQVARWYNVEVVYEGNIPQREYRGELLRNSDIGSLLQMLSYAGIRFRIEGQTIIVYQ